MASAELKVTQVGRVSPSRGASEWVMGFDEFIEHERIKLSLKVELELTSITFSVSSLDTYDAILEL